MAVVKQRFRKSNYIFRINVIVLIALLIVSFAIGFLLSDSGITGYAIFEKGQDFSSCEELLNTTYEFMDDINYWRNDALQCNRQLWTLQFQLKQAGILS